MSRERDTCHGRGTLVALVHYVMAMHQQKLHPIFADTYLATLDGLPVGHPINRLVPPPAGDPDVPDKAGIWAAVDVVLRGADGTIVALGVVRPSGVDEFDAAVLETFERAAPYGAPPAEALSADGNLYLGWTFFRSPRGACSAITSRPRLFR